jgi:secreted PhoX family phosphatase
MPEFSRRNLMSASLAATLGASVSGVATAADDGDTPGAPSVRGSLKRFSSTALGAEVTGPFVFEDGSMLYSLQHPSRDNEAPFDRAGIGYVEGFQFEFDGSNDDFEELSSPQTKAEQAEVRASGGDYVLLAQEEDEINGGEELLGVAQTPEGENITVENFAAPFYSGNAAYNPDCNQFVATDDAGTEGYLFTNWENSPGNVSRIPLSQDEDSSWEADLENAINLANTEPLRELGGTRINCYGDRSPWDTMLSAEENYAHPRVSLTASVSDIEAAGSGKGLRGGHEFWNRPDPSSIQSAVDEYYGDDSWYVQGYWALGGTELLAYYLGADQVDEAGEGRNTRYPIGDTYPNPYDYGYIVDFREPAADPPQPVKYYVMGRASWEAPDVQADRQTVYLCSDGDSKGIYKFVADEPIPSYDDPMDVAGTLYAPKVTNEAAVKGGSPAEVPLHVEWLELGHATNAEVKEWIAEYDDVTQQDYLEAHAETDWTEDLQAALEEADREVVENGTRNYVTDEEILRWAEQYEAHGPDGVDEELRKVAFLETRAAAKEIGGSIEFNKAEGVDSVPEAGPGDFVYFGISEFNDDLANDEGDVQLDRVDGGVVYRGELGREYNVTKLEPVITGPDGSDPADVADDALINVDNVYVMRDGRVLCCEDADQFGRSYPNDCLYVYEPNVMLDVGSTAIQNGGTGGVPLTMNAAPNGLSGGSVTVTVEEPNVAAITDVEFADGLGLTEAHVSNDGSTATLRFSDVEKAVQEGALDVMLASLGLRAKGTGTTDLTVSVDELDDEAGADVEAETRMGMAVTGPPTLDGSTPTDPDGDGEYEDLNGNGRLDYDDVVLLFEEFDSEAVQLNESAYDFNDNGELDYDDIVSLYEEA